VIRGAPVRPGPWQPVENHPFAAGAIDALDRAGLLVGKTGRVVLARETNAGVAPDSDRRQHSGLIKLTTQAGDEACDTATSLTFSRVRAMKNPAIVWITQIGLALAIIS